VKAEVYVETDRDGRGQVYAIAAGQVYLIAEGLVPRVVPELVREARAWQNVKGATIPDWIQGRGTGEAGEKLVIIVGRGKDSKYAPVTVWPGDWVVDDPRLDHLLVGRL